MTVWRVIKTIQLMVDFRSNITHLVWVLIVTGGSAAIIVFGSPDPSSSSSSSGSSDTEVGLKVTL